MAYPLDSCPAVVKDSDEFSDTLEALAPYESVADIEVQVPPVADKDNPFVKSVRSGGSLTPLNGTRPQGVQALVGWYGGDASSAEYAERSRLRQELKAIYDKARFSTAAGPVHPQARKLVGDLTVAATTRLNEIRAIYDKWKARRLPSKYGDQTPDGKQDLNLSQSVGDYLVFSKALTDEQIYQAYQAWFFGTPQYIEQTGWTGNIRHMPANIFWSVLVLEQVHDRKQIRDLYREAYKMLWCAEYGVAQSQSYYSNKARFELGPGGKQAGVGGYAPPPPPAPAPGPMLVPAALGGFKATFMPGQGDPIPPPPGPGPGPQVPVPPMQFEKQPGIEEPPVFPPDADAGEGGGEPPEPDVGPDAEMPPDTTMPDGGGALDGPIQPVAIPWYRTAAARAGLAMVVVAGVGVAGYGVYRYMTAPRYA